MIENLFDIPGIGYLLMDSIKSRDYPVIQGCVIYWLLRCYYQYDC